MAARARYWGAAMLPRQGAEGDVVVPHGFDDPESPEYGAVAFVPDKDEDLHVHCDDDCPGGCGVYCPQEELEVIA